MVVVKSLSNILRSVHRSSIRNTSHNLCAVRYFHRETSEKVENSFRLKDSVPSDYRLIYRAPLIPYVKVTYGITTLTVAGIPVAVGSNIFSKGFGVYPIMLGTSEIINSSEELFTLILCMSLVLFQVTYTVFKYPFRIYHNSTAGKYIAIYQHFFPFMIMQEEFNVGEMKKVEKSFSIWHQSLYQVNKRKLILLEDYFAVPDDMNKMMSEPK